MAALTGRCWRDSCRGQRPKYIQTLGSIGGVDLGSLSFVVYVLELGRAFEASKKAACTNFNPLCSWCNRIRTQNQFTAQWLGCFCICWLKYIIPSSQILSPIEVHLNSKIWFPFSSLRGISNTKASRRWHIQHAAGPDSVFFYHQDRMGLGAQLLFLTAWINGLRSLGTISTR